MTHTDIIRTFLEAEGFRPEVDADGDLHFKYEGGTYYVLVTPEDPQYYQIVFPNFWSLDSDEERLNALIVCDALNRNLKLVKLYSVEANTWVGAESVYEAPEAFVAVLPRVLTYMQDAARAFKEEMFTLSSEAEAAGLSAKPATLQ